MQNILENLSYKLEMNDIDVHSLAITVETEIVVGDWLRQGEPNDLINRYWVNIELVNNERIENEERISVGKAVLYFLTGYNNYTDEVYDMRDIADAESGDLITAIAAITTEDGDLMDDYAEVGVLYIEEIYINPPFRNKGIGYTVFALLLDTIGRSAGVALTIAYPLQTEESGVKDTLDFSQRQKKLEKFLKNFGFELVDEENRVWAKNLAYRERVLVSFK